MTVSLAALEQHAAQATETGIGWYTPRSLVSQIGMLADEDKAFIAACDPATITALVRAVRAALAIEHAIGLNAAPEKRDEFDDALTVFRERP